MIANLGYMRFLEDDVSTLVTGPAFAFDVSAPGPGLFPRHTDDDDYAGVNDGQYYESIDDRSALYDAYPSPPAQADGRKQSLHSIAKTSIPL